tara:strand:+ start:245 stop:478 length:234 start_codon:yes stop_codon:yes gene_type:complete
VVDNKKLASYIRKRLREEKVENIWVPLPERENWREIPTEDELSFWIQQFKTRKCVGHSEWSERYQCNIWVSDYEGKE